MDVVPGRADPHARRSLRQHLSDREARRQRFTDEDEELVSLLAAQAAVAIENARLYQSATRWSRQLETLHEIVRSIVDETDLDRLLTLVCQRVREVTGARIALAALPGNADGALESWPCDGEDGAGRGLLGHASDAKLEGGSRLRAAAERAGRLAPRRSRRRAGGDARRSARRTGMYAAASRARRRASA